MDNISNAVNMSFRVDRSLKKEADALFKKLGLNTSVALNMFLSQSVREQAIPFSISMNTPNQRLLDALEESEAILNGKTNAKKYDSFDDILKDLNEWNIKSQLPLPLKSN